MKDDVKVRYETNDDWDAVRRVNEAAFGTPLEANLVDALRVQAQPAISLVAIEGEKVVGHILFSSRQFGFVSPFKDAPRPPESGGQRDLDPKSKIARGEVPKSTAWKAEYCR